MCRGRNSHGTQNGLVAPHIPASLANVAKCTGIFPGYHFSWVWSLHDWNFSVCTRRISDKMCDVPSDQGLAVRHVDQRLLLWGCSIHTKLQLALRLWVLDLGVEGPVNVRFCHCVHTFPFTLNTTLQPPAVQSQTPSNAARCWCHSKMTHHVGRFGWVDGRWKLYHYFLLL